MSSRIQVTDYADQEPGDTGAASQSSTMALSLGHVSSGSEINGSGQVAT